MVIARRQAAVAITAVVLMLGGAAAVASTQIIAQADTNVTQADRQKPRPTQPVSPPGLDRTGIDRPDEAKTPLTGRGNQFK